MISAVFCVLFGLSLLPGRKPLCLRFAERISGGIMPDGAEEYCRRLTWIWFVVLFCGAVCGIAGALTGRWALSAFTLFTVPFVFAVELPIRRRRFRIVFHTSGSTGRSKTIVKTFESLAKEVEMHRNAYRALDPSEVTFLGTVDPAHMLGKLWREMLPKAMGAKVVDEVILTPETLLAHMSAARKVFLVTTPSFLERFTAYADQYDVPRNCVEIITSGSALPPAVSKRTKAVFGIEPKQIFGSTETGGIAWMRGEMMPTVFDCVKVKSVGGRLAVKSPFSFRRGWYVMGDGVELSGDGRTFRLLGRMDRLVKINEERVNLAEMETKVRALGYRDCACVAIEGVHGACLGLVIAGKEESPLEMRRRLVDIFPKGTVPKKFRFVEAIPKNTQGKVLKGEIEKMF